MFMLVLFVKETYLLLTDCIFPTVIGGISINNWCYILDFIYPA